MSTNTPGSTTPNHTPDELVSLQVFSSPAYPPSYEADKRLRLGRPAISPNYPEGAPDFDESADAADEDLESR